MDEPVMKRDNALADTTRHRKNKRLIAEDKENERDRNRNEKIKTKKKKKNEAKTKDAKRSKKKSRKSDDKDTKTTILLSITPNAVESLVSFSHSSGKDKVTLDNDLVVRIRVEAVESTDSVCTIDRPPHDQLLLATLDDGTHTLPVMVLNDPRNEALQAYLNNAFTKGPAWMVAIVRGMVATDGHNPRYELDPIICLTTIVILSTLSPQSGIDAGAPYRCPHKFSETLHSPSKTMPTSSSNSTARVRAGTIGSFLDHTLPFLTTDEFVRCHDTNLQRLLLAERTSHDKESDDTVQKSIISLNQHAEQVQTFLTRHSAMITLQTSQPTEHAVQNYNNALREFSSSQLDRQKASLATNAGREAADRAHLITQQYNAALEEAMGLGTTGSKQKDVLTSERLLQWHSILLEDLHSEAGRIRSKTVRAGNTVFCRPKDICSELDKFCQALTNLQQRLHLGATSAGNTPTTATNAWHAVLFAAVAMYGIVDIHPFADGNGRISRIVANWALKAFPFTINLFATPAQRAEYVLALEATRHLLSLSNQKKVHGTVTSNEILQVTKSSGIFAPLVRLLMDRMGRAVVEFHRVWQEKLGLAAEALECKAARQARERAKEGTCIICLDENPNIATLCCGKAVHLNCIAEWLSGKNSCPCCRSELPSISGRVVRAARNGDNDPNSDGRGPGGLFSPSRRRLQRRYFQNAQDVIVSLLSNYGNNNDSSTETAEDDVNSAQDTTTVEIPDEDEDDDDGYDDSSGSSSSSDEDYDSDDIEIDDDDDEDSGDNEERGRRPSRSIADHPDNGSTTSNSEDDDDDDDDNRDENQDSSRTSSLDINILPQDTTTADDDEEGGEVTPRVNEYCDALYCRNRPAIDCTNNLCGRCCVLGGEFHCPRHNS